MKKELLNEITVNKKLIVEFINGEIEEYIPEYGMEEIEYQNAWDEILKNEDEEWFYEFAQGWIDSMTEDNGDVIKIEFREGNK